MIGIGCMSGTSLDGLDMACVAFEREGESYRHRLLVAETVPFDEKWRSRLAALPQQSAEIYAKTNVYFGHWLGQTVRDFIEKHGLTPDFVASHGQTIFHQPQQTFTAQIGDGETMVRYLPCKLITNFRNKDVAYGGEGAPLVPFGEQHLFPEHGLFLNLGGIANLSYTQPSGKRVAFDVVPCNLVMNYCAQHAFGEAYDRDGQHAAQGTVDAHLLESLNNLPFFAQKPPKSLGWEWVLEQVMPLLATARLSPEDTLRTYAEHVATQIATACRRLKVADQLLLSTGGGSENTFLMRLLAEKLAAYNIRIDSSVSPETVAFKEAIIFAFLGLRVLEGLPNVLPSVTGAKKAVIGGSIHLP